MIGRIAGRLDWKGIDQVLIDCKGVGYIVYVNDRTMAGLPPLGEAVALYTDLLVREDLLQLFGFPTMMDREWHKLLTTVQGVGAKASMAILGALGAEGVARAITLGDARAVQSANGVGPKLAQRVILELKSKAPSLMAMGGALASAAVIEEDELEAAAPTAPIAPKARKAPAKPSAEALAAQAKAASSADALSALVNLGYGHGDAAEAVAIVSGETPEADTPALIRLALKRLAPK